MEQESRRCRNHHAIGCMVVSAEPLVGSGCCSDFVTDTNCSSHMDTTVLMNVAGRPN